LIGVVVTMVILIAGGQLLSGESDSAIRGPSVQAGGQQ
jgi:hypothetical protein